MEFDLCPKVDGAETTGRKANHQLELTGMLPPLHVCLALVSIAFGAANGFTVIPTAVHRNARLPSSHQEAAREVLGIASSRYIPNRLSRVAEACEKLRVLVPDDADPLTASMEHVWVQTFPNLGKYTHYVQLLPSEISSNGKYFYLCCYSVPKKYPRSMLRRYGGFRLSNLSRIMHDPDTKVNVVNVYRPFPDSSYCTVTDRDREKGGFGFCDFGVIWSDGQHCIQDSPCIYELDGRYNGSRKYGYVCRREMAQRSHAIFERVH